MAAKLKVFGWSDGFHAYAVATTSKAKALAAWGVTRDLFKDGDAHEITSGEDHDAALSKPGETIRRGVKVDVGKISAIPKPNAPNKADRERVATLERRLADLESGHLAASAKLADRRSQLDEEEAKLETDYRTRSADIAKDLERARQKMRG